MRGFRPISLRLSRFSRVKNWSAIGKEFQEVYDKIGKGDKYFTILLRSLIPEVERHVSSGSALLDLGCGPGYLSRTLSSKGYKVYACDVSRDLISIAKQLSPTDKIHYFIYDIEKKGAMRIPQVNCVILNMVIMYLKDIRPAIETIYNVLKPGGYVFVTLPHPCYFLKESHRWFENDEKSILLYNYFERNQFPITFGNKITVMHYHKTLSSYIQSFLRRGFNLVDILEIQGSDKKPSRIPFYLLLCLRK